MFKNISKTVWLLSLVSLCNDFSSEMLYPIIPLFLQQTGYGSVLLGLVEGFAESIAGLSKIYMGTLSDKIQKRLPFIQLGYLLSTISRPIIGLTHYAGFIVFGRGMDKIGKGIRTGARDALLADESTTETRAEVFGFHRSVDTLGAVLGPLVAIIFLHFYPEDYKTVFLIATIPGICAILFTLLIKEKKQLVKAKSDQPLPQKSLISYFQFYKEASPSYLHLLFWLILFSLVNSSDMFLLLRAKELGSSSQDVLMLYLFFNVSYALLAYPIGKWTNKLGEINMLIIGFILYATSYTILAAASQNVFSWIGFLIYGSYYAFSQGAVKVLLLKKVQAHQRAGAIGFYEGLNSLGLFVANALTGLLWFKFGSVFTLFSIAGIVLLIALVLYVQRAKHS